MADNADDPLTDHKRWTSASGRYQELIGNCTRVGTRRLVEIVNNLSPFENDSFVLDSGAGGGSLTMQIKEICPDTPVLATDISEGMLEQIDALKLPNVTTRRVDAVGLPGLTDGSFTHAMSSFAIQFTPNSPATVEALYRVTKPDGIVGLAIWGEYTGPADIQREACQRLNPSYEPPESVAPGAWSSEKQHKAALEKVGLRDIGIETVQMPFRFDDAKGFCKYWFGYGNPVPGKYHAHWRAHGGDMEALEREVEAVVREKHGNGADIYFDAVLGWGRK